MRINISDEKKAKKQLFPYAVGFQRFTEGIFAFPELVETELFDLRDGKA